MTKNTPPHDSENDSSNKRTGISVRRRRFMQSVSAAAGAGLFGVSATETVAADEFHADFANRRVREAKKAWGKGFRGQPDRTLAILSDGLDARHPDLGPWNGVRAVPDGKEGLKLIHQNLERLDAPDDIRFFAESRPLPSNAGDTRHEYPFTGPENVHRVEAHVKSSPPVLSNGLKLLLKTADGEVLESHAGKEAPHTGVAGRIKPGKEYVLALEDTTRSVEGTYKLEAQYFADGPDGETDPFADVDRDNITADTPKVLGWYNEDFSISGPQAKPRNGPHQGGHGTFLASIMAGSGRASVIDETTVIEETLNEALRPGDTITYEVEADPGRGVYGVAFGKNIQIKIYGPEGDELSENLFDSTNNRTSYMVEAPTVHDDGLKTYEMEIAPYRRAYAEALPAAGHVGRVSVGVFKRPDNTVGDRTDEGNNLTLHGGIAPNSGLVGLSGWLKTRQNLRYLADDFASLFNLRVLGISLGFGESLGIAGGNISDRSVKAIKALAEEGVLTVSRSPNTQPPAYMDRSAAGADEAISVAQAGPWDGIFSADSNEPAAIDEDGQGAYWKPDLIGPATELPVTHDGVKAAKGGNPFRSEAEQEPIRDYGAWGFISQQTPFVVGTAGLVAQALEEEAPDGIALPAPEDAGFVDTMRLKQTILATATETPFTAARWHRREPSYDFGGHDPVEGWGRVNIDTAVEAASRDLTPPSVRTKQNGQGRPPKKASIKETVGLNIPRHSRAVAGYVDGNSTSYEVSIDFSGYSGEDHSMADGPPHVDLFVYDAENPAQHGTPNIVTRAQGVTGSASVRFGDGQPLGGTGDGTYYVVAKLVDVPNAYNSFDIRAHLHLSVEHLTSPSITGAVRDRTDSEGPGP
jgi:hypothetical protein